MPYTNPFRKFGGEHKVEIIKNRPTSYPAAGAKPTAAGVFNFKMVCSCQFEVLCRTMEEAESWKRQHLGVHGVPVEGKVEAVLPVQ